MEKNMKKPRTISEFVYDQLKDDILSGKHRPGERLVETNLAKELDVSRTPVREALSRLEIEGLITMTPHRGIFVTELSKKKIQDYYQTRAVLEGLAAELAAINASEEDLVEFTSLKNKMDKIFERDKKLTNYEAIAKSNNEFHKLICKISKNEVVTRMLASLDSPITLVRTTSWTNYQRKFETFEEHNKIASAILQRNPKLAKEMAEEHVHNVWKSAKKVLEEQDQKQRNTDL